MAAEPETFLCVVCVKPSVFPNRYAAESHVRANHDTLLVVNGGPHNAADLVIVSSIERETSHWEILCRFRAQLTLIATATDFDDRCFDLLRGRPAPVEDG